VGFFFQLSMYIVHVQMHGCALWAETERVDL